MVNASSDCVDIDNRSVWTTLEDDAVRCFLYSGESITTQELDDLEN